MGLWGPLLDVTGGRTVAPCGGVEDGGRVWGWGDDIGAPLMAPPDEADKENCTQQ